MDPATAPLLHEASMEDLIQEIRRRTVASVLVYEMVDKVDDDTTTTYVRYGGGWNTCVGLTEHAGIWLREDRLKAKLPPPMAMPPQDDEED